MAQADQVYPIGHPMGPQDFDRQRPLIALKEFKSDGQILKPGDPVHWITRGINPRAIAIMIEQRFIGYGPAGIDTDGQVKQAEDEAAAAPVTKIDNKAQNKKFKETAEKATPAKKTTRKTTGRRPGRPRKRK